MITTEQIKALREKTGVSIMQCKKALEEANGDAEKATVILQKKSKEAALKKSDRTLGAGTVASYVHNSFQVGVMVMLCSETDFVSGNEEFKKLAYDIAMHIAAMNPEFIKAEDITEEKRTLAKSVFEEEVKDKPEVMREKILEGKLSAYFAERILLEQKFIKDGEKTIQSLIETAIQKFGEKIEIAKFVRYSV